ncbi:MAG TPA: hypothetical protein VFK36_04900 [Gemmatimonadales bacterium]|nr:hypothetical protein [Gemmatimonadales bacterium]
MSRTPCTALLAALMLALVTSTASAKPPWVSIELPANPMNRSMHGAYLLVHSYHVGQMAAIPLTGTATGMVDGKRQVISLVFEPTDVNGVSALRRTWPVEGSWVLAINAGGDIGPTALVSIANGIVRNVNVPTVTKDGFTTGRKVTQADVDQALKALAVADDAVPTDGRNAALALALAGLGVMVMKRRS